MRKNILPRKLAKPIEQLSDGTWIILDIDVYCLVFVENTDGIIAST